MQQAAIQFLIGLAFLILFGAGCFFWGMHVENNAWKAKNAAAKTEIASDKKESEKVTKEIEIRYVDRVKVIEKQGETVINNVHHYITADDNSKCVLPVGFFRMIDDATAEKKETK